eukprot:TRINITY_DN4379_c0_g1_i11.p1 TRINITY_DN4379_c0_g1~~TRINITY_DN4379_c0_g1_i11.p1  ORF type:complete len:122 (-),score=19.09 TRINITY_DN4379_c0_g1_i11:412-777(-)
MKQEQKHQKHKESFGLEIFEVKDSSRKLFCNINKMVDCKCTTLTLCFQFQTDILNVFLEIFYSANELTVHSIHFNSDRRKAKGNMENSFNQLIPTKFQWKDTIPAPTAEILVQNGLQYQDG